jgi:ArsR family transcriptional regulator
MYKQIFELHSNILKALSHPKRLEIVHLLRDQEISVGEIQSMLDLPQANLSQHLQILRENHIVSSTKKGKQIFYRVAHPNYVRACDLIREILIESHKESDLCQDLQSNLSNLLPIGIDPICGMKLTPKTAAFIKKTNGVTYYFCASGCLDKYNKLSTPLSFPT